MPKRQAFTLVELLVVIGIIAVLVAILLPALNAARAQSRSVQCMSNMRQVAGSVLAYADANKNRLPWNYFQGDKGELTWNGISLLAVSKALSIPVVNDVYTSNVLICPADEAGATGADFFFANVPIMQARYRNSGTPANPSATLPTLITYGACLRQLGIFDGFNPPTSGTTATSETFKIRTHYTLSGTHPTWVFVFAPKTQLPNSVPGNRKPNLKITQCRKGSDTWIVYENSNCDLVPGNMVFRHPKFSANFGYLDGHVENLRTTAVDAAKMPIHDQYTILVDPRINLTP